MGVSCTLGSAAVPPPQTPPSGKILTHAQVIVYAYISVKFQLCSSINVQLTENSLYNRFCIESYPKMGFWGDFGARGKHIWWEPPRNAKTADLRVFRHLWSRSASRHQLLVLRYRLSSLGRRSFAVAGPMTWNSLSADLRDPTCSDESFRRSMKTFLFAKY